MDWIFSPMNAKAITKDGVTLQCNMDPNRLWTRLGCPVSASESSTVGLLTCLSVGIRSHVSLDPEPCSCVCYATPKTYLEDWW